MQFESHQYPSFDPTEPKLANPAITTNSPFPSQSPFPSFLKKEQQLMDTSFQSNLGDQHSAAIWKASLVYLTNTVSQKFDEGKGFNDAALFESAIEFRDGRNGDGEIWEMIGKNGVLGEKDKRRLIAGLGLSRNLRVLVQGLVGMFCEEILEEIIVVVFEGWQKYLAYKESTKISEELSKLAGQSFTQLDPQNPPNPEPPSHYPSLPQSTLTQISDQSSIQIAGSLFMSTKLRYLNFREGARGTVKGAQVRQHFEIFIGGVVKAVFLCCEGWFVGDGKGDGQGETEGVGLSRDMVSFQEREFEDEYDRMQGRKRINQ